jgi:antitoxin component YwqK of YwqJK toxin-antitoxin module
MLQHKYGQLWSKCYWKRKKEGEGDAVDKEWYKYGIISVLEQNCRMEQRRVRRCGGTYYVCGRLKGKCFWKDGKMEGEEMMVAQKWSTLRASVFGRMEKRRARRCCGMKMVNSGVSVFGRMEKRSGEEMLWHENGQLWKKCFWKDGKQEGEEMWWHKNGQL